ncbi:cAMP-binding domain of CRP or a regulatory subunit of cAMP-dependent protein kinases [Maridesulfovibrio ferrireducens]|uniref:cAMP-binding domain of CRP or a regulatory subunit of cAMP-dependent protein kinases n=1 Tax=Maridesulfovibrio ferrireducens TaxID=246191 RepID=A0A1G9HDY7_9BACT|nr:Crp/Fnr family transcriptional regulator [Maridesulfovibrio ferrireducens]SDL11268.1 cAMP-binding domain of CRP or a regulatory subunit of cAMP-dependent protein kinases [Maridesulfovibrio ferrireducens]
MKFSGINLLDELQRTELADLRDVFNSRRVKKGAIIFSPDQEENLVFIVEKGRVRIYLGYEDKEFTLGILEPGDLYSTHAGCFVQALEDSSLLTTDVQSVKRCMVEIPLFNRTMVRVLGKILQNSFSVIGGLAFKDIYARLAAYLLKEAQVSGIPVDGGFELELDLTIEQLSQILGATRQTVSTLINNMVREGLVVKRARSKWFVPDLKALEDVVNS